MNNLFEKAPIHKAYFQLALPVVFSMVASMAYNLADTFFVSQTQNADLVAGVSICTPLFSLMLAFGDIFGIGGSALISRLLGEGNKKQSARISSFCFYAAIVFSAIVTVIMLIFERPILALMGATNATYQYAAAFYRIMAIGGGAIIVSLVPGNLLRTEGLAVQSMIGTISGVVITIILDPVFIFTLGLGAGGAASATVVGYLISTIILTLYTIRQGKVLNVKPALAKVNLKTIIPLFTIGIPASITNLMQSFGTALLNNYLAPYGAKPVAALGISLKIYLVVMLFMIGFAFGAQPLIGYNYGSQNKKRFYGIIRFDLLIEIIVAVLVAGVLILLAPQITGLFMHDPTIIKQGTTILRCLLITTPLIGVILVFTTVFQSANKAVSAFLMSITRQGVLLWLVIAVTAKVWGYYGIIWAQPLADVLTFVVGCTLYLHMKKSNNDNKIENK